MKLRNEPKVRLQPLPKGSSVQAPPLLEPRPPLADAFGVHGVKGAAEVPPTGKVTVLAQVDQAYATASHSLATSGKELKVAATELGASPVGTAVGGLGEQTQALSEQLSKPGSTVRHPNAVYEALTGLHDQAKSLAGQAGNLIGRGVDAVERGYQRLTTQVTSLAGVATRFASEVSQATDIAHNVDQLGPQDSYLLFGHAYLGAGVKLAAHASVFTSRDAKGYTVEAGADVLAGLMAGFGTQLGPLGGGYAELGAVAGGGGAVGFRFDNPADASRAAKLLAKAGVTLTKADVQFLKAHLSSVELTGAAFADAVNSFSLASVVGTSQYGRATSSVSLRLEKPGGEAPVLVMRSKLDGWLTGTVEGQATPGGDWLGLVAGTARGQATLVTERRASLPSGTTAGTLLGSPGTVLKALNATDQVQTRLTMSRELGAGGRNRGHLVTFEVEGSIGSAAKAWLSGDVPGALSELPSKRPVKGQLAEYQEYGVELFPKAMINGVGGGLLLIAQRQDVQAETTRSFELEPGRAVDAVKRFLSRTL